MIILDGVSEENYSSLLAVFEPASDAFGNWFITTSYLKSYDMNETGTAVSEIETEKEREGVGKFVDPRAQCFIQQQFDMRASPQ